MEAEAPLAFSWSIRAVLSSAGENHEKALRFVDKPDSIQFAAVTNFLNSATGDETR